MSMRRPERVFALWTDLQRMGEWVGGVTSVTDISGPVRHPVRQLGPARQVLGDIRARR